MAQSKLANGLQCSNCGGYMVYDRIEWMRPVHITSGIRLPKQLLNALVFIIFILMTCAIGTWLASIQQEPGYVSGISTGVAIIILLEITFGLIYLIGSSVTHKDQVRLHQYRCNLCGYAWEWREDQPKPEFGPITPRPDLIQKGQERLRRDAQNAAADAYQRQLRGEL